jgi:hypothetical protein
VNGPFENSSELYDWRVSRGGNTKDYQRFAKADVEVLAGVVDLGTARTCDVGCGNGVHLTALCLAGAKYPVGIDLSEASLLKILGGNSNSALILQKTDIMTWGIGSIFDAVLCSLPPINSAQGFGLRDLLPSLRSKVKTGGYLLLKVFDFERAIEMLGEYAVTYDGATTELTSTISQEKSLEAIRICQYFSDLPSEIHAEVIDTPAYSDVHHCAVNAQFEVLPIVPTIELPGTRSYLMRAIANDR